MSFRYRPELVVVSASSGALEGWRLPTVDELSTLVDDTQNCPTINPEHFPGCPKGVFWSATRSEDHCEDAWVLDFTLGQADTESRYFPCFVRLVRRVKHLNTWPPSTFYSSQFGLLWQRYLVGQEWDVALGLPVGEAYRMSWDEARWRFALNFGHSPVLLENRG